VPRSIRNFTFWLFATTAGDLDAAEILWTERTTVSLAAASAAPPQPPFSFVSEDTSGRSPKIDIRDANGVLWSVKFGPEVHAETFATRLAWALGYHSDTTWYIAGGTVEGASKLKRTAAHVDKQGRFREARFEHRDSACRLRAEAGWSWENNPFLGSRELHGLKLLTMLLSNWDHKDARDADSNTGILDCAEGAERRLFYYVTDWGGSLGKWGRKFDHTKWDCEGFASQSAEFVEAVENGFVKLGFTSGRSGGEFKRNISVEDAAWFLDRFESISENDIREGLRASGADDHETEHLTTALLARTAALRDIVRSHTAPVSDR
jgi:hypothetical protein